MSANMEQLVANTILQGFDAMYGRFLDVTAGAQHRFEQCDWPSVQFALKQRINFYDHHVGLVAQQINAMLGGRNYIKRTFLMAVKAEYITLLDNYPRYDIAESFFNSVYCRIFEHRNIDREKLFVCSSQDGRIPTYPTPLTRTYSATAGIYDMVERLIDDTLFTRHWEDKYRDIIRVTHAIQNHLSSTFTPCTQIEIIREPFYRNKGSYLIGKLTTELGSHPFVLPLMNHPEKGLYIDACIMNQDEISKIFGFARSYFMVYAPAPAALVRFLRGLLPNKTKAELYTAIGCQKHGKTELYRQFLRHLEKSDDQFVTAPGIKGMVMTVFTLPSYDFVFKIIKDKFAPPKDVTHKVVKEKYRLVKEHDRVGRMADTLEYRNFTFSKNRFSDELLEELLEVAPSIVKVHGKEVFIKHLYMERRMTPLNIYMDTANEDDLAIAVNEYALALKQLAAANIFPGDMLFKNFGVSRHKRVIFYDYDEISYMTEMNFRNIPAPRFPEDEMAAEPWYSIGQFDVFPEEFSTFLLTNQRIRKLFMQNHKELFEADYWRKLQSNINAGQYEDVYPYSELERFK